MAESLIETRTFEQLSPATAVSPDALTAIQEPDGPVVKVSIKQLLGRLVQVDTTTETEAELQADLDHDDATVGLVFADPDPAKNGWYRKVGASGAGYWSQFEKLSAYAAAEIAEYVGQASNSADAAAASAAAALAAAGVSEYANTAAGLDGTVAGQTFWVDNGDGSGTTYRHDPGPVATELGKFIKDPTDSGAAGLLGIAGGGSVQQAIAWVTPEMTGEADDGDAIEAAIDRLVASGGGTLQLLPRTYVVTSEIYKEIPDGMEIRILGYGAKIDLTSFSSPDDPIIRLGGKRTATNTVFASSPVKGAQSFDVASAAGLAKGKCLLVTSTDLFNPTRAYYYKGEIVQISEVSGATIRPAHVLYDGYDHATTTLHLLDMPRITVEGVGFVCNGIVRALLLEYCKNPVISNIDVRGARYAAIEVNYYLGGSVRENNISDAWYAATGTSYGVSIGSGQGISVSDNKIFETRHMVTGGGKEPARDYVVSGNIGTNELSEILAGSMDAHGNCDGGEYVDNICSGYSFAGRNLRASGGRLVNPASGAPGILIFQEIDSDYYDFNDISVDCLVDGGYGFWLSPTQPNLKIGLLKLAGLGIKSVTTAIRITPRSNTATGCSIGRLQISDTQAVTSGNGAALVISNQGAAAYTIDEIVTSQSLFEGLAYDAVAITSSITVNRHVSTSDTYRANRNNGYLAQFNAADLVLVSPRFVGNTGGAGNSRSVYYIKSGGTVRVVSPSYSGLTRRAELEAAGPASYAEIGFAADTPAIINTAAAALRSDYIPTATAANIAAKANAINTTNKFVGRQAWDSTNNRMMRARGTADVDPWDVIDGSASVVPA